MRVVDPLHDLEQPVKYSYRIRVPQLARWDGDELRLDASVLRDLVQGMARLPARKYTLDLSNNRAYVEERTVKLPSGLVPAELPAGGEASSPFGRLRLQFTQSPGAIVARTELTVTRDRVAPSEYPPGGLVQHRSRAQANPQATASSRRRDS